MPPPTVDARRAPERYGRRCRRHRRRPPRPGLLRRGRGCCGGGTGLRLTAPTAEALRGGESARDGMGWAVQGEDMAWPAVHHHAGMQHGTADPYRRDAQPRCRPIACHESKALAPFRAPSARCGTLGRPPHVRTPPPTTNTGKRTPHRRRHPPTIPPLPSAAPRPNAAPCRTTLDPNDAPHRIPPHPTAPRATHPVVSCRWTAAAAPPPAPRPRTSMVH